MKFAKRYKLVKDITINFTVRGKGCAMTDKSITIAEFRERHNRSGESVLDMAFQAQAVIDDEEFKAAAALATFLRVCAAR